jgi:regulator of sigma E protease
LASTPNPQQPPDGVTPTPPPPPPPAPALPPAPDAAAPPPDDAQLSPRAWLARNVPYLLVLAGIFALLSLTFGLPTMWYIVLAGLGLGFVIFIHELGHFAVAKWCDVYVETFSIGFGPALPGCRWKWGETVYKLALFPLGGYVKMLGENPESDEEENNPRSFKNKTVGQRMAIISAGVIMNIILACVCFIVVFSHGKERKAGEIGMLDTGGVAWEKGVPVGAVIRRIGNRVAADDRPLYFEDLTRVVIASAKGEELPLAYDVYEPVGTPDARPTRHEIKIEPRTDEEGGRPMVGLLSPSIPQLISEQVAKEFSRPAPVAQGSPAAAARKAVDLRPGDTVLATTDPDKPGQLKDLPAPATLGASNLFELSQRFQALAGKKMTLRFRRAGAAPGAPPLEVETEPAKFQFGDAILAVTNPENDYQLDPLPPDPRNPSGDRLDYFALHRRLVLLTGQLVTIRVKHKSGDTEELLVPPGYHHTLGLRMAMGPVTAVREPAPDPSPAAQAGVQKKDILHEVLLEDDAGNRQRFLLAPAGGDGAVVDPVRLPDRLAEWAYSHKGVRVTLTVRRDDPQTNREQVHVTLPAVAWDYSDRWRFNQEQPLGASSPLSIPGLGLAYRVRTLVEEVSAPADAAGVQPGDQVKAVRFKLPGKAPGEFKDSDWVPLKEDQWASFAAGLQSDEGREVSLQLARGDTVVTLTPRPDPDWPATERGLLLDSDTRLQQAAHFWQALWMGAQETFDTVVEVYYNLRGMITGRISPAKNVGGPLTIGVVATKFAGQGIWELLFFLGLISANLAVINFLPVPFLDGGHMMFLTYEGLRGKPAPESVQLILTYAGIILLLLLMATVIVMDVLKVRMFFF